MEKLRESLLLLHREQQELMMYSCCYATIAGRNLRCLVTAGKHVNNTRAIARQLLGKRVTAATDTHATVEVLLDYNNRNGVFYVVRAEML
jgi:hypothetical protein